MITVIHDIDEMQRTAEELRSSGKRIAVVPTMGALHGGHAALIRGARGRADVVVTTVFVNPAQFGAGEDFSRYPRDLARDAEFAVGAGSDIVFAPVSGAMYPEGYQTFVDVEKLSQVLEGRARPGHFRGVATVVAKLFLITRPHVAFFGQKDAQQVQVIRRLVRDLNFHLELVIIPIVRETDGLALSSRNVYLTPAQRREAPVLYRSLQRAESLIRQGERNCQVIIGEMARLIAAESSGTVDYISIADGEMLEELTSCPAGKPLLISLAVRFGTTRLIDNITLTL